MVQSDAQSLAMRLLELQQRFESYVALHEEELEEIKAMFRQMRRDILLLNQPPESEDANSSHSSLVPQGKVQPPMEAEETPPLLTL